MNVRSPSRTVSDLLLELEHVHTRGARFIDPSGAATFYSYREILRRVKIAAATLQKSGVRSGDRVAVVLPTSIQFLDAFLGAQLAGAIPVALYPPFRLGRLDEYKTRLREMLTRIGATLLIADWGTKSLLGAAAQVESLERVIEAKDLVDHAHTRPSDWSPVTVGEQDTAFLQFSSGTTFAPKAVQVTHANLLANIRMMTDAFDHTFGESGLNDPTAPDRGALTWLPLYHDMGLVGFLYQGLAYPATVTFLRPDTFIAQPDSWLRAMSKYEVAISAAPSFAYGICTNKIADRDLIDIDLSKWLVAFNGSEPIDVDIMEGFCTRFAQCGFRREAMTPVYGLAEAVLGVSFPELGRGPVVTEFDLALLSGEGIAVRGAGRKLSSVGRALPGLGIEIRDPAGRAVPQAHVGLVHVSGPCVMPSYYRDPERSEAVLGDDGWLDTGDLGFYFEDNLYIAGRAKDVIILRGANHAPQEFEEPLNQVEGVRRGCVVAISVEVEGGGEQMVLLVEQDLKSPRAEAELIADIHQRLLHTSQCDAWHVELLAPGTLPRTSSGKLRRAEARRMFLAGELTPPDKVSTLRVLKEIAKSQLAWARFAVSRSAGGRSRSNRPDDHSASGN